MGEIPAITCVHAQETQIELTKVDITKIEGLVSTKVQIFGVHFSILAQLPL